MKTARKKIYVPLIVNAAVHRTASVFQYKIYDKGKWAKLHNWPMMPHRQLHRNFIARQQHKLLS